MNFSGAWRWSGLTSARSVAAHAGLPLGHHSYTHCLYTCDESSFCISITIKKIEKALFLLRALRIHIFAVVPAVVRQPSQRPWTGDSFIEAESILRKGKSRGQKWHNFTQDVCFIPLSERMGPANCGHRTVFALIIINKAGGLIYNKVFHEAGLQKISTNDYLVLAGTFHG